jgi:hypothetical protein
MRKIMFKDKYGLTKAVLEGRKTMTRRIVPECRSLETLILTAVALVAIVAWMAAICITYEHGHVSLFCILFVGPFAVGGIIAAARLIYAIIREKL